MTISGMGNGKVPNRRRSRLEQVHGCVRHLEGQVDCWCQGWDLQAARDCFEVWINSRVWWSTSWQPVHAFDLARNLVSRCWCQLCAIRGNGLRCTRISLSKKTVGLIDYASVWNGWRTVFEPVATRLGISRGEYYWMPIVWWPCISYVSNESFIGFFHTRAYIYINSGDALAQAQFRHIFSLLQNFLWWLFRCKFFFAGVPLFERKTTKKNNF